MTLVQKSAITDDGVEIVFDDSGRGRPVIWLHGITDDRTTWTPVTALLSDRMRCIRIDFRGHGQSASRGPYSAGFVSDVATVIRETGTTSPVVIGHSLGGVVATLAAAMGMTGPVVCVDQPLQLGEVAEMIRADAPRLRDPATYAETLMEEKLKLGMRLLPTPLFCALERTTRSSNQDVSLEVWRPILDNDARELAATEGTLADALSNIDVPYLALHGQPVDPGYEQWVKTKNPAATFEHWPGLGHWLHLVDPERFATRISDFIDENALPHSG